MPWLRLLRISAWPSAASNILMAFLLVVGSWTPTGSLVWLLCASLSLYGAGMVLNDWFDRKTDARQRPQRPIPSGAVSPRQALVAAITLIAIGWLAAAMAGWTEGRWDGRPLGIAAALTLMIYLYDGPAKESLVGPLLMGACRGANVLLGASLAFFLPDETVWIRVLWVAAGLTVLVTGVTWLGQRETEQQQPGKLLRPALTMLAGLAILIVLPWAPRAGFAPGAVAWYPLLLGLVSLPVIYRTAWAVRSGTPGTVQLAVVTTLRSLVFIDATICWLTAPGEPVYAVAVLALIIPATLLGRVAATT